MFQGDLKDVPSDEPNTCSPKKVPMNSVRVLSYANISSSEVQTNFQILAEMCPQ